VGEGKGLETDMLGHLMAKFYQAIKTLATRQVRIECDRIPYHFHNVPLKKILNRIVVETFIYFKRDHPWGWQNHLQIEPMTHCNLSRALCPVTVGILAAENTSGEKHDLWELSKSQDYLE